MSYPVFDGKLSVAVFSKAGSGASLLDLAIVHLEADKAESAAADAVARGYAFCGTIAVADGEPKVSCEPGHGLAMMQAGNIFAGMLGPLVKEHQQRFAREREKVGN